MSHGKICETCLKKANFVCSECFGTFYCGAECQNAHVDNHHKRCSLIGGRKWPLLEPQVLEQTRTVEEARKLIDAGANPYEYIGNGRIALDEMVKWYPIREFLYEARVQPPKEIRDLIEQAKANTVNVGKDEWNIGADVFEYPMDINMMRLMIYHGFFPVFKERSFNDIAVEHLFFHRYDMITLRYWLGIESGRKLVESISAWRYRTLAGHIEEARKRPDSFALLLFAPHLVYKESKRAKNDMAQFRTAESVIVPLRIAQDKTRMLPVTRYADGMSRGLFFSNDQDEDDEDAVPFCGTFYYMEPESTTYLRFYEPLYAYDKHDAAIKLRLSDLDDDTEVEFPPGENKDMLLTPSEMYRWKSDEDEDDYEDEDETFAPSGMEQNRKFYAASKLDVYALQDILDQDICYEARQQGYDVIILTHMIGSRQIVTEILDTRDRATSFRNLYYLEE